jgi:hypothetical protein
METVDRSILVTYLDGSERRLYIQGCVTLESALREGLRVAHLQEREIHKFGGGKSIVGVQVQRLPRVDGKLTYNAAEAGHGNG